MIMQLQVKYLKLNKALTAIIYSPCYALLIMKTTTYIGTIKEETYGYRMDYGYDPSLSLECENGESVALGNSRFNSYFADKVGQRIKLTIEELEPLVEDED